jgi:hypothetical protein
MNATPRESPPMYVATMGVFLNRWFTTYEAARAARAVEGGFLFPFRNQFFITDEGGVRELGLDPADPAWERIGWDWVRPLDRDAWESLVDRRWIAASES